MPDRHILLMVSEGTSQPIPAATAAWRAGICPAPAVSTWPMITYSTSDAGTLAFSSAPEIAIAPRSLPEKSFSEPISLPTGVRAPATITDVVINASKGVLSRLQAAIHRPEVSKPMSLGYLYVMTAEQVDARPLIATALITAIDHVGIAVADLDAAIKW